MFYRWLWKFWYTSALFPCFPSYRKWSGTKAGLNEKSANIQRKALKGFKKHEELLIKTTLKKMTGVEESLAAMKKLVVAKEVLHSNEILHLNGLCSRLSPFTVVPTRTPL